LELFIPMLLVGAYVLAGWIAGVVLALRTRTLAANEQPKWRKLFRLGCIMTFLGWISRFVEAAVPFYLLPMPFQVVSTITIPLWIAAMLCPAVWMIALFLANKPELPVKVVMPDQPHQEGVWPPPPAVKPEDSNSASIS